MLKRKSQASLEYLTTYAWAFITLIVAIGAIQYFGLLDFQKYLPQKCIFTSQFKCFDFAAKAGTTGEGEVSVKLLNSINANIRVQDLLIENRESPQLQCTGAKYIGGIAFTEEVPWNSGEEIDIKFTGCSGGGFTANERVEAIIRVRFYSPETPLTTPPSHEVRGKITAVVKK